MSEGFYKRRRGILEHIEAGTIDLLESGIHDFLSLKANLLIGSPSSLPVGVCFSSAPAVRPYCKRWVKSDRTMQRVLEHMEEIGWIKTWPQRSGNYPVLLCRASVHDLSGNEYRINADATTDWQHPVYEPVGELSGSCPQVVGNLATLREKREESREKRNTPAAKPAPPVSDSLPVADGFEDFYKAYPKHVGKEAARRAWRKVKPEEKDAILARVELNKIGEWAGKEKQYIPNPASWLNGQRWTDEILGASTNGNRNAKPTVGDAMRTTLDAFRQLESGKAN